MTLLKIYIHENKKVHIIINMNFRHLAQVYALVSVAINAEAEVQDLTHAKYKLRHTPAPRRCFSPSFPLSQRAEFLW